MKIATQHYQDSVITPYGNNHWNGKEKIDISKEKGEPNTKINVTISIGVYEFQQEDTPQALYQKADKALYDAKTHGRNKVVIFQ